MTKHTTFRLDEETLQMLDEICELYGCSRTDFIRRSIWGRFEELSERDDLREEILAARALTEDFDRPTYRPFSD